MNGMWRTGVAVVLTVALSGAAGGLQAQSSFAQSDPRVAWAEQLSARGMEIAHEGGDLYEAVTYLRQAALLRGSAAGSVRDLHNAGRLAWYAGHGAEAVSILRSAGETALALGMAEAAAEAFLDGAWVALRQKDKSAARDLVRMSDEVVGTANGLREDQRRRLRDRVSQAQP